MDKESLKKRTIDICMQKKRGPFKSIFIESDKGRFTCEYYGDDHSFWFLILKDMGYKVEIKSYLPPLQTWGEQAIIKKKLVISWY